ncbi:MAG: hypothetical protein ACFFCX_04295, partial [Candidatus Sifarchaeia archaeon]
AASATVNNVSVNVDTWFHWGYYYNISASGRHVVSNNTYLKSNGVFSRLQLQSFDAATGILVGELEMYRDGIAPIIESPDDIAYEEGESGHSITWDATDLSPGGYMVLKDDVEVKHGFWNSSSEEIIINVDGLSAGSHNYTIVFYEASGISASDTVIVSVSAPTTMTTTTTPTTTPTNGFDLPEFLSENILLIGLGVGVVALLVIAVVLRRR